MFDSLLTPTFTTACISDAEMLIVYMYMCFLPRDGRIDGSNFRNTA